MITVVAGSRSVRESEVFEVLSRCPWVNEISSVISGTAYGADRAGEKWAEQRNIEVIKFPAEWDKYGLSAGPRRNREMAENADALVAIWDGLSSGTLSMIHAAKKGKLRMMVYRTDTNKIEYGT